MTLTSSAARELHQLPTNIIRRIDATAGKFGCLAPAFRLWRIRVGDYRIVYVVDDVAKTIGVTRIAHRREAYD